jgi:hypothetical protein
MYLQAVTVCVNYSDFLAQTIAHNKQLFDHWIIVTTPEDKDTQKLCQHYNVECLVTNEFTKNGDPFNKAKGINVALQYLSKHDWVIHLDADIYLPPLTRGILERISLDKNNIYGVDRMMCPTFEAWNKYITNPEPTHTGWVYIHGTAFPFGVRIGEYMSEGYEPIGFFQLWHPNTSGVKLYPETHGSADRTDVQFSKLWKRSNRTLIPEVIAIHLDSENSTVDSMGKNWNGRKTKHFGVGYSPLPTKKPCLLKRWFGKSKK